VIDEIAKEIARSRYGLPDCLHVPIAAVDEVAISTYVGTIVRVLNGGTKHKALLVEVPEPPPRDDRFPIWDLQGSTVFFQSLQVWVDVSYTCYRPAYHRALPDVGDQILSHAMNRRVAALKGFKFVRLTPTSRRANSSSAFSENWGVALHGDPTQMAANRRRGAFIQYADLTDLMLLLDLNLGGGVMEAVNEGQRLTQPRET
jgi:hypothetical protein